ncbi:MAG: hypothetical protein F6K10_23725 [Moorea sp. SIO2B7]|nr:hypothetical protein [Moorena sp. SIO2B7]
MTNYSCMAIGINRYNFIQPLSYAQADAEALEQFLVEEGNLSPQQCLLLTDASAWVEQQSTYPNLENILYWLNNPNPQGTNQNYLPPSVLWFFFSGYGVHHNGKDYLMPIDGNPRDIPGTGIEMRSLFESLQKWRAGKIVAFLDMNRAPGLTGGTTLGEKTIELAAKMGIATVLSSRPNQFSHEAAALGHGMFTAALLEALRYYRRDLTLVNLDQYLRDRLPELSEHHWRPIQTPIAVFPALEDSQKAILPLANSVTSMKMENIPLVNGHLNSFNGESDHNYQTLTNTIESTSVSATIPSEAPVKSSKAPANPPIATFTPSADDQPLTYTPIPLPKTEKGSSSKQPPSEPGKKSSWLGIILALSGLIFLAILFTKILDRISQSPQVSPTTSSPTLPTTGLTTLNSTSEFPYGEITSESSEPGQKLLNQARMSLKGNQASSFSQAIAKARQVEPNDMYYDQAQLDINRWSWIILDIAQGRAVQNDYLGAIFAAKLVPQDQKDIYAIAQKVINDWEINAGKQLQNQILIQEAKKQINPNQASSYIRAIKVLRQISPDQLSYKEAQELIDKWSRQIYLIANSRASREEFDSAIEAAKLVPQYSSSYQTAQKAISKWEQGKK